MKTRIQFRIALLILILIPFISTSQFTDFERDTKWNIGINFGGLWQDGDIQLSNPGFAGGFTLGKGIYESPGDFWSASVRFRYLTGRTFGQNLIPTKAPDLLGNSIYSTSPSDYKNNLGFTYYNSKSVIYDYSLELALHFHALRERTGILLSVFGGVGVTDYRTTTDLLNEADSSIYDYNSLGANPNKKQLIEIRDNNYETYAMFNENVTVKFMPSLGFGLGYQFSPKWSIGFEHRVTFALNDKFDGVEKEGTQFLKWGDNDKYHYSSVFLRLNIFRGKKTETVKPGNCPVPYLKIANATNNYEVNEEQFNIKARVTKIKSNDDITLVCNDQIEQTIYNNSTDYVSGIVTLKEGENKILFIAKNACGETSETVTIIYNPSFCPKPVIEIKEPKGTVSLKASRLVATVFRLQAGSISVKLNGQVITHQFNKTTEELTANLTLKNGSNTITVKATNKCGESVESTSVFYDCTPPTVSFSTPQNGKVFTSSSASFIANVTNVANKSQITVTVNGATSNFNYDTGKKEVTGSFTMREGTNVIVVAVKNDCGTDSKTVQVVYEQSCPAPVVYISSPANGTTVSNSTISLSGTVSNISASSQLQVKLNGVNKAFSYNASSRGFTSQLNLSLGNNTIVVSGSTNCGTDTKTINVIYREQSCPAPVVHISSPANGTTVSNSTISLSGTVSNISASSQLQVKLNGVNKAFSYNASSRGFTSQLNLSLGNNTIVVSGSTNCGTDTKTINVIYREQSCPAPVVYISSPANGTTVSNSTISLSGTVSNISASSQLQVKLNGVNKAFSYNASSRGFASQLNLSLGNNTIVVSGSTNCGTDTKTINVVYREQSCPAPVVHISSPANGTTVSNSTISLSGTVSNISASSQLQVKLNGVNKAFSYNASSRGFTSQLNLSLGNNTIVVSGSTNCGTDTKTLNVVYREQSCPAPVVYISSPVNGHSSNSRVIAFSATTQNVQNASQLTLKLNGVAVNKNFTISNGKVSATLTLRKGGNTVELLASTNCGSDSKNIDVSYRCPNPTINIASPNQGMSYSITPVNFNGFVSGVSSKNQIHVKLNNVVIPFNYNTRTNEFTGSMSLIQGANTLKVSVTNSCGTIDKVVTVSYTKPCPKPTASFTSPANSSVVRNSVVQIEGLVNNVSSKSDVVMKLNGVVVPFTYNASTKKFLTNVNLIAGNNTIEVSASTNCGQVTENLNVIYEPCVSPTANFTSPANGKTVSVSTVQVKGNVTNLYVKSNLTIRVNGVNTNFTYNSSTKEFVFNTTLKSGYNTIQAMIFNDCGEDSKILGITYTPPCYKPVINITTPNNNHAVSSNSIQLKGTVTNISSQSNLVIKLNNKNVAFYFNPSNNQFTANLTLAEGVNRIELVAGNNCGDVIKVITVNYTKPCEKPAVSITSHSNKSKVSERTITLKGLVRNVDSKSNIQIKLNGVLKEFTYDTRSKLYTANLTLKEGSNKIDVYANTRNCGRDLKSITVVKYLIKPIIKIYNFPSDSISKLAEVIDISGTVEKITSQSQFTITVNGVNQTKYAFTKNGTDKFSFSGVFYLNFGLNTLVFRAVHSTGGVTIVTKKVYVTNPNNNNIKKTEKKIENLKKEMKDEVPVRSTPRPRR